VRKVRVMIVDDHLVVREGLKQLLEVGGDIEVVAEVSSGLDCLHVIEQTLPDIIFMDIKMPGINGIEITRLLTEKHPRIKVVILTIYDDNQYVTEAVKAGAKAYMLKDASRKDFLEVIDHVLQDKAFLDPNVTASVFDELKRSARTSSGNEKVAMTTRELQVIKALVDGLKDREIAESLNISEHTVHSHVKNVFRKLKVSSRSQAISKALQAGLIDRQ
jgi:DNA-binding NarL/FixJ family response regulator